MRISDWSSDVCSSDLQRSEKAVFAPGDAREDWSIFRALADTLGVSLGFDSFAQCRAAMVAAVPALGVEGMADYGWTVPKLPAKPEARAIPSPIKDFYLRSEERRVGKAGVRTCRSRGSPYH